jgi:hypothetical protein
MTAHQTGPLLSCGCCGPHAERSEIALTWPSNKRAKDKSAAPKIRRMLQEMALMLWLSQAHSAQSLAKGRHRKPRTLQSLP